MKLQIVLSSAATADQVAATLQGLGHEAVARDAVPGLVDVHLRDSADAPTLQRIAARLDHPAVRAATPA